MHLLRLPEKEEPQNEEKPVIRTYLISSISKPVGHGVTYGGSSLIGDDPSTSYGSLSTVHGVSSTETIVVKPILIGIDNPYSIWSNYDADFNHSTSFPDGMGSDRSPSPVGHFEVKRINGLSPACTDRQLTLRHS